MNITGIICEYNPLHLGHKKQLDAIRANDPDGIIVCLMSGNYVQRGKPAVFEKSLRAKAAISAGADLVLELPITAALSSAENFAAEGVRILTHFCTHLCFGAETKEDWVLMDTANALLRDDFPQYLRKYLNQGLSFPSARAKALEEIGVRSFAAPNDILALEYCKAILTQSSPLIPVVIHRDGDYHSKIADPENPSATALRNLMAEGSDWLRYIPEEIRDCFRDARQHTLEAGQRAVLAKLRTMTDAEFASVPYGSEGLWRKFMHCARKFAGIEEILTAVKSKRYTRSRLDRMLMCAFLGITEEMMASPAPYVRLLALNDKGRALLRETRDAFPVVNAGEAVDHPYWELEKRLGDLYGLFCVDAPEPPCSEENCRVVYVK